MALIKHNKIKNTGILFEVIARKITSDTLSGIDSKATSILKRYFVNTELGKEYKLYETLFNGKDYSEPKANMVLEAVLKSSKHLNKTNLRKEKYNLIKELKELYDLDSLFKIKLDVYKKYAAFSNLLEMNSDLSQFDAKQVIDNKITIIENLTKSPVNPEYKNTLLEEFKSFDKDTRILTQRILMEKFNSRYEGLTKDQKRILKEYINSIESTPQLREFYNKEIKHLNSLLETQSKKTTSPSTKIKIEEITKMMVEIEKNQPIKTDNLVDLLQYHSLVDELSLIHG